MPSEVHHPLDVAITIQPLQLEEVIPSPGRLGIGPAIEFRGVNLRDRNPAGLRGRVRIIPDLGCMSFVVAYGVRRLLRVGGFSFDVRSEPSCASQIWGTGYSYYYFFFLTARIHGPVEIGN